MMPFCNNLRKGDVVEVHDSGRRGVVAMQPRESSIKAMVLIDGLNTPRYFPVGQLRLVVDGVAEAVPPVDGEVPVAGRAPTTIQEKLNQFEGRCVPLKMPSVAHVNGEHLKHYLVTYIREDGKFHIEKVAAPGIVQGIQIFYFEHRETAIVSVVCVL